MRTKRSYLIILFIISTILIGCGDDEEEVIEGMTVDKAISILGKPIWVTKLPNGLPGLAYFYEEIIFYVEQGIVITILDYGYDDL